MNEELAEHYRILDLSLGAPKDAVKGAYRELVKVWHPDRFAHDSALQARANEKLRLLNEAFSVISRSWEVAEESQSTNSDRRQEKQFQPIRIDKFRYYDTFVDEINASSEFDDLKNWPPGMPVSPKVSMLEYWQKMGRERYNFSLESVSDLVKHGETLRGILDFANREITLSELHYTNKTAWFLMFILYFRNPVTSRRGEDPLFALALERAGWNGPRCLHDVNYLKAEWKLAAIVTADLLRRVFNADGSAGTIKASWREFKMRLRVKKREATLEEYATLLADRFFQDPSYWEMQSR
jgi:DnaJ-like protein